MDIGLSWISDLVAWLVQWVPRWALCRRNHRGVKFRGSFLRRKRGRPGCEVIPIEPGLFWWWPATTEVVLVPAKNVPHDVATQSLCTSDGKSVAVSTSLVIDVVNQRKAIGNCYDLDVTIAEIGASAAVTPIVRRTWKQLRDDFLSGEVEQELFDAASEALAEYGVEVKKAVFTDLTLHTAYRNLGTGDVLPEEP